MLSRVVVVVVVRVVVAVVVHVVVIAVTVVIAVHVVVAAVVRNQRMPLLPHHQKAIDLSQLEQNSIF